MARKTKVIVCPHEGRDKGKHYLITEMPASESEEWAIRAFLALAHSGVEVPEEIAQAGMAGLAIVGLQALGRIKWEEAKPLLDKMMTCVQAMPDPTKPELFRGLVETDIEEAQTRFWIRAEVFELHTGFSFADAAQSLQGAPAGGETSNPSFMSTFLRPSAQS